jgi:two-component system sensor histidine kinase/response regulator
LDNHNSVREINILIVEDSPSQALQLRQTLESHAYRVTIVNTGKDALRLLQTTKPSIIISDIIMPGMDGYELCKNIKKSEQHKEIPVILLTQLSDPKDIIKGLECGADHFITKPYDKDYILSHIQYIVTNRELRKHSFANLGLEIFFAGQKYLINSNRIQIVDLLFSTYEIVLQKKRELETANQKLKETNSKLKRTDQVKNDFLSIVSHELRTPIAIMREGISLCMDKRVGQLNPVQKKLLTDTENNLKRLTHLVNDLLDVSKIEEGKLKLRRRSMEICRTVEKLYEEYKPQTDKKDIRLIKRLPQKPVMIYADEDKIIQIFNNLLNNALHFTMSDDTITIGVKDRNNHIECYVSDTGVGIDEKHIPKLFQKFEQIDRVDGPGYKGTGLGLAICKGLAEKHKGKIWAESELGKGATFRFTIPKISFPKIMIVDDEENVIEVIEGLLANENYQFLSANDGENAVKKIIEELPSLVILDIRLKESSGYEVIGRLKQDQRTVNIPILVMSAYSVNKQVLNQLNKHSVIPTITKPFEPDELKNKVRELIWE